MLALALALTLAADAVPAPAAQPPAQVAPAPAGMAPTSAAPAPAVGDPDDFDLLAKEAAPDAAALARQRALEAQLSRRRTMLQLHQLGGFLTVGALAAAVVLGQLNYADKYGGGGDTGRYYAAHEATALGSTALFVATGALAIFAPSPLEKRPGVDTATLHKLAVGIAAAGMAAEVALGFYAASRGGHLDQRDFALAHQIIGYTTLAATTAGFTVFAF